MAAIVRREALHANHRAEHTNTLIDTTCGYTALREPARQVECLAVIDAILASGTDSEERWVRIAGGDELEQARAAARDTQRSDGRAWANGVSQLAGDLPVSVALFETPGSDDDARDDEHTAPRTDEDSQLAGDGPGQARAGCGCSAGGMAARGDVRAAAKKSRALRSFAYAARAGRRAEVHGRPIVVPGWKRLRRLLVERKEVGVVAAPKFEWNADCPAQSIPDNRRGDRALKRNDPCKRLSCHAVEPSSAAYDHGVLHGCLLYTSPSPRDGLLSRMPSSA